VAEHVAPLEAELRSLEDNLTRCVALAELAVHHVKVLAPRGSTGF
jgi:hypothetical protein